MVDQASRRFGFAPFGFGDLRRDAAFLVGASFTRTRFHEDRWSFGRQF
jgi:hypothetical protein